MRALFAIPRLRNSPLGRSRRGRRRGRGRLTLVDGGRERLMVSSVPPGPSATPDITPALEVGARDATCVTLRARRLAPRHNTLRHGAHTMLRYMAARYRTVRLGHGTVRNITYGTVRHITSWRATPQQVTLPYVTSLTSRHSGLRHRHVTARHATLRHV